MKTYYGHPADDKVLADSGPVVPNPPPDVAIGDTLCDGHQMHYEWDGTRWA